MSANMITASLRVFINLINFAPEWALHLLFVKPYQCKVITLPYYDLFSDPDKFNAKKAKNAMSNNKTLEDMLALPRFA